MLGFFFYLITPQNKKTLITTKQYTVVTGTVACTQVLWTTPRSQLSPRSPGGGVMGKAG